MNTIMLCILTAIISTFLFTRYVIPILDNLLILIESLISEKCNDVQIRTAGKTKSFNSESGDDGITNCIGFSMDRYIEDEEDYYD
jgi:hypothetical protein